MKILIIHSNKKNDINIAAKTKVEQVYVYYKSIQNPFFFQLDFP